MRKVRTAVLAVLAAVWFGQTAPASAFSWPQEVGRIERQLSADDPAARRAAALRLERLTPAQARPLLSKVLEDPDVGVRLAAAQAVEQLGILGFGRKVLGWLQESDARLRAAATDLLILDPVPEAVAPLGRVLADPDPRVRKGAALALGEMGRLPSGASGEGLQGRAAAQLLGRLDDPQSDVRIAVIDSLARLGDARAVLPLVAKTQDSEPEVRVAVVRALGVLGDARASGALLLAARDRDPMVVSQAVQALGWLADPGVVPSLVVLSEELTAVAARRAALVSLAWLGRLPSPQQRAAIERLVAALGDPDLRASAQGALRLLGAPAVPELRSCLAETSGEVSLSCGRLLATLDPEAAFQGLRASIERGSLPAATALNVLAETATRGALIFALEHLTHPEPAARDAALRATRELLERLGGERQATGPLLAAAQLGFWSVEQRAILLECLGRAGDAAGAALLAEAARSKETRVREAALIGLGRIEGHGADDVLLEALDDADAALRRTAALSLRSTGAERSARELLDRLEGKEGQDREAVALALRGPLSRTKSAALVERARKALTGLPGPARDSVIEALAAVPERKVVLAAWEWVLTEGSPFDRAKLAEALGFRGDARDQLLRLAQDASETVRAQAVWSLGASSLTDGEKKLLTQAIRDGSVAVATNAVAALGRGGGDVDCELSSDRRAAVRANAVGVLLARRACGDEWWSRLLRQDPAEQVRVAVARGLALLEGEPEPVRAKATFELRRCSAFERSARVARSCAEALARRAGSAVTSRRSEGAPELVFVASRQGTGVLTQSPFVAWYEAETAQGRVRAGWTDRRGVLLVHPGDALQLLELQMLRGDGR